MPYCNDCGKEYLLGVGTCPQCASGLPQVAGQKQVTPIPGSVRSAPTARRLIAGVIDLAIAYGLLGYILFLVARRFPMLRGVLLLGGLALLLVPNPYLLLKDAVGGKSIGKLIAGLVAYNDQDRRATGVLDSMIRNWYLVIPAVGPTVLALVIGMQILAGQRSRLGDAATHTSVITDLEYQRLR